MRIVHDPRQGTDYSSFNLIRDTAHLLRPYSWQFIVASASRLVSDIAWLYPPVALASIVTYLGTAALGAPAGSLWIPLVLWGAAIVVRSVGQFFGKYLGYQVAERVALDATLKATRHLFRLDMAWHERENSGNKIQRIQNGSNSFNTVIRIWFGNLIEIGVNFVGVFLIIFAIDRATLILLAVFIVVYFTISTMLVRRAGLASYAVNRKQEEVNGVLFEAISNIRSVKVMDAMRVLYALVRAKTDELFGTVQTRIFRFQSRSALLTFVAQGSRLGILGFIAWGVLHGHYELGFLILFNGYFSNILESVSELSSVSQDFVTSRFSIGRYKELLDEPVLIDDAHGKGALAPDWQTIEFKDVSFSYGNAPALEHLSFTIHRGERIGIVGLSGAGKSTLFKLLLKEREEFTGDILFDGVSIKRIERGDYFKHVSVVLQDTEVFNLSLRDNVTITDPHDAVDQKRLAQALEVAHVADFLPKLPQGLDTLIGEKGIKLSGGERQRLGIARAIYRKPELLLMDEATSHLDLESEEKIRDSLHQFFKTVTAVVIAHRLTTIREMDTIHVVERGRIIESGNFAALTAKKGRFYELWEKQKL